MEVKMAPIYHVMAFMLLVLTLHRAQADRRDHRWLHLPDRQRNLISGQDCMLEWIFELPEENRNIFMTVTHFRDDREDGMTIASRKVKPSNRNPVQMDTYHDKGNITANYQTAGKAGNVTVTLHKWTPEESGDIYIHIDMPPIPLTALTIITVYEDTRWNCIPNAEYEVIVGKKKLFTWQFIPPSTGEFDITILQDKVTYGMYVATEIIQATDTEPVQLRVYADYKGRVKARYIPASGTIEMTVLQWTLEDTGEIFVQVDVPLVPLTASTYIKVFESPMWTTVIPETIRIPESTYRSIEFSRSRSKLSPSVLNVTVKSPEVISESPLTVTILPLNHGFHIKYSDPSMFGRVYLSADTRLEDVSLRISNMSQLEAGKYEVTFHFNVSSAELHRSFHIHLERKNETNDEQSTPPKMSTEFPGSLLRDTEKEDHEDKTWQFQYLAILFFGLLILALVFIFMIAVSRK